MFSAILSSSSNKYIEHLSKHARTHAHTYSYVCNMHCAPRPPPPPPPPPHTHTQTHTHTHTHTHAHRRMRRSPDSRKKRLLLRQVATTARRTRSITTRRSITARRGAAGRPPARSPSRNEHREHPAMPLRAVMLLRVVMLLAPARSQGSKANPERQTQQQRVMLLHVGGVMLLRGHRNQQQHGQTHQRRK